MSGSSILLAQIARNASEKALPEEKTLQAAQSGDLSGFRQLIGLHQKTVYGLAWRLLGSREEAEELAQDVFLQLYRHLHRIESVSHLGFWLRRTVSHRAIDRLRQRPRQSFLKLDAAADIEIPATDEDPLLQNRLRELVAKLPPMPRAVVLLRFQEDLDPTEIALTLDLPLNTVKSHLRRSLAILRQRCAEWMIRGDSL